MSVPAQIGVYTIERELGRGGMGVVYLGHDTRLDRKVAIKALPEHLADDPERLARFEREAKLLASLTHPNLAGVYGLEEDGSARHLVMEFVEGDTLAATLAAGPLAPDDAMRIAAQVAAGVEAAHEAGVIHRDLKPGNIIVTPEGKAKVLDFGLAKEVEGRGSSLDMTRSPTMTSPPPSPSHKTQVGQIMGTAAYLSPEQARGRRVDRRTDIWAFGCVLYEMLTGDSPYQGETITDSLGAILHKEPDWERLPASTPPVAQLLLRRCLVKDADRRLRDIGDARVEIEEHLRDPTASRLTLTGEAFDVAPPSRGVSGRVGWIVALILAVAAAGAGWAAWSNRAAPPSVQRFVTLIGGELEIFSLGNQSFAISPDGRTLALIARPEGGTSMLYVRPIDEFDPTPRQGTESARMPFFSPDSEWIGYFADGRIMKVPTGGGSPVMVCRTLAGDARGATWTDDGQIIFSPNTNQGLFIVPASGGEAVPLTTLRSEERSHRWPHALPGSSAVLFTAQDSGSDFSNSAIEAVRLDSGERIVVHRGGSDPLYARSGHLIFGREEGAFGAAFDPTSLRMSSQPVLVLDHASFARPNGDLAISISDNGVTVTSLGGSGDYRSLLNWAARDGARTPVGVDPAGIGSASISPDGERIAYQLFQLESGSNDLWVEELARGVSSRVTFDPGDELSPVWSPDGQQLLYTDIPRGSFPRPAVIGVDGSGKRVLRDNTEAEFPQGWLDDGTILMRQFVPGAEFDIVRTTIDDPSVVEPVVSSPFVEDEASVSPDGRWLAFVSNVAGQTEVFVRPFPSGPGRWQVSAAGGQHPIWSPSGDELYFLAPGVLMAAPVNGEASAFEVGTPEMLFEFGPGGLDYPIFAVHPDGERFLLVERDPTANPTDQNQLAVTLNWFQELRERAPR